MNIFLSRNGQQHGPYSVDDLNAMLETETVNGDDLCWYEGCETWIPLSQFPGFGPPTLPPPPPVPKRSPAPRPRPVAVATPAVKTDALGISILAVPAVASLLMWTGIGNQSMLMALTVLVTAILVGIDAKQLGVGSATDLTPQGKRRTGPLAWSAFTLLLWFAGYPIYIYCRSKHGAKNLLAPAVAVALVFQITPFLLPQRKMPEVDNRVAEQVPPSASGTNEIASQRRTASQMQNKPPYDFSFGHIPFGLEIEEVLALMKKVPGIDPSLIFTSPPSFNPWDNAGEVEKMFPKGLYTYTGMYRNNPGPSFHPQLVTCVLTRWPSISSPPVEIRNADWKLYFQKDVQDGRHKLFAFTKFLVGRVYRGGSDRDYLKAFSAMKESMTKEIGKQPSVFETKYTYEEKLRDATGAIWDDPVHKVIFVANGKPINEFFVDSWRITYISKDGFENYLGSLTAAVPPTMEEFDKLAAKLLADMTGEPLDKILDAIKAVQAADKPTQVKQFSIAGSVIQKLREGLLVKCIGAGGQQDGRELAQGVVLLVDHPKYPDLFPAEYVNVMVNASDAGTFEYITTRGAKNIVRRLKYKSIFVP